MHKILSSLVTLLTPVTIIMIGVIALLHPFFPEIEYRMPGFPEDTYGFTLDDRLQWSKPSIEYLVNGAEISYLADLKFSDGRPIYNERELSHMHDVKLVVQNLLNVWRVHLVLLVILALWAWRGGWVDDYRRGLRRGGFLTIGLLVFAGVLASLSFWDFFTYFHSLFFTGDSWLFYYSDTLIRLFPMRFWQDCFIYVGAITILLSLVLGLGLREKK